MMDFLLNTDKVYKVQEDPNTTVLEYLRKHRLCGTKEGCASGDCGACTVVVASLCSDAKKLHYQSVNSCICLLGDLAGKQLISVEALRDKNKLHCVQQAMVEAHASQCGYCTPGFIMSLFALFKNSIKISKEQVLVALGGNLCRCTGYRPIIDAALSIKPAKDKFTEQSTQTIEFLKKIQKQTLEFHPRTVAELSACWRKYPKSKLVCGGTDLVLLITQRYEEFNSFIYLKSVKELNDIQESSKSILIGAAVSLSRLYFLFQKYFPSLADFLHRFASLQIRNQASLGGNLANASAIADTPPALMVLGANIILRKENKSRKIALQDFFIGYKQTVLQAQEFIEQIEIPKPNNSSIFKIYKVSKREEDDISTLCGAFSLELDNLKKVQKITIAFCGMSAFVKCAQKTQNFLQGQKWDEQLVVKACCFLEQDYIPMSDFRATKNYRMQVCKNLLTKFYLDTK